MVGGAPGTKVWLHNLHRSTAASSALQSLEGWQLMPQQISWLRQQRGPRVVAERTRASSQDCMCSRVILTPPLVLFLPLNCTRILVALKLIVPAGRKSRKYGYCNKWIKWRQQHMHVTVLVTALTCC